MDNDFAMAVARDAADADAAQEDLYIKDTEDLIRRLRRMGGGARARSDVRGARLRKLMEALDLSDEDLERLTGSNEYWDQEDARRYEKYSQDATTLLSGLIGDVSGRTPKS